MLSDQPTVVYNNDKKKDKGKDAWKKRRASRKKLNNAVQNWEKKRDEINSKPKTFSMDKLSK